MKKVYRALATGLVDADAFEVDAPIGPVPHCSWAGSIHGAVPGGGKGAKQALSRVRVLRRDPTCGHTLVQVEIPTGRPHQIRIHMAYAGHPLVGDPLYVVGGLPAPTSEAEGRPPLPRDTGYFLHATSIELDHPLSGEPLCFKAPPPRLLCFPGEVCLEESLLPPLGVTSPGPDVGSERTCNQSPSLSPSPSPAPGSSHIKPAETSESVVETEEAAAVIVCAESAANKRRCL